IVELARKYASVASYAGAATREWEVYLKSEGVPTEQIFELSYGGCGPPPAVDPLGGFYGRGYSRYRARFSGARIQEDVERLLRDVISLPGISKESADGIRSAFAARDAARARLDELRRASPPPPTPA